MSSINGLNYYEILQLLNKKEISCKEIMEDVFDNIEKYDRILECYISLYNKKELLSLAEESDKRRMKGNQLSEIDGIPIAVKDNIHSKGIKTTCGSRILKNYNPPYESTVVSRIKQAGGIVIGKTNMDEFAMGSTTESSAYRHTKNPWDINKVPGGSSGGSAASISTNMSLLALGSDTGGSIRQPASFCGVVGIKPTYGLVSRFGLVAYASSLDQIGTFANDVYGAASLLGVISGYDTNDSTSLDAPEIDYTKNLGKDIKGLKVAVLKELSGEGIAREVLTEFNKSLDILKKCGASVEEVSFEAVKYVIATYYFIATAEASSNLSRYDGVKYGYRSYKQDNYENMLFSTRSKGFGHEVKKRILLGNFVLSSGYYDEYYRKAQKIRTLVMNEMKKIFQKYDVIAIPTTPDTALDFGESMKDPLKVYILDITTSLANLTGVPAISVPCGFANDLPVGLQLIGRPLGEEQLLNTAYNFEKALNIKFIPPENNISDVKYSQRKDSDKDHHSDDSASAVYSKEKITEISEGYNNRTKSISNRVLCRDLEKYVGKIVILSGWIHKISKLGGVEFYTLRDRSGMTQLVLEKIDASDINPETVVEIEGRVTLEDRSSYNNVEIKVDKIEILGNADSNVPIKIYSNPENLNLPTILDNRHLSIRNPKILSVFKIQSDIVKHFSEFLRNNDFSEIKTPKIISQGTEGGSNIFELKYFERTAFLAQSPQFYKQMMVGSGFERVFEVGPVFRAEMHDTIRHLNEYTSLDFEMGFIRDEMDIIDIHEKTLKYIFDKLMDENPGIMDDFNVDVKIPVHIPRIHFLEALEIADNYGVKNMDGDISPEGERVVCEYIENEYNSSLVYIIGYPAKKRPMYTMPDERLPGYTRSFDLLFKGLEITTGGQRIHDYKMLRDNIKEFGGNPKEFKHYLETFKYGMPPHGGLGMGLERITMKFLNLKNVREASLFPRDRNRLAP